MKKIVGIVAVILVVLVVIGAVAGGDSSDSAESDTSVATNQQEESTTTQEEPEAEEKQEESKEEKKEQEKNTFNGKNLVLDDYTIKITDYKVIQPGQPGNEYGDKPVIAFWYDTTNTSGSDDVDPTNAWIWVFKAIQDNDPNKINELDTAMLPDDAFTDSQLEKIKDGGTVSNAAAYELDDLETPVTLRAEDILGNSYGEKKFKIKGK